MHRIFISSRVVAVAAGVLAVAISAPASADIVDFETLDDGTVITAPEAFTNNTKETDTYTFGTLTVSGGQIVAPTALASGAGDAQGNVYGSGFLECPNCWGAVVLDFSALPVSQVQFTIYNPHSSPKEYKAIANKTGLTWRSGGAGQVPAGESQTFTVTAEDFGDISQVPNIQSLAISDDTGSTAVYVDNITFNEGGPAAAHVVSFRTFIPNDNVPAGKKFSCTAMPETTTDGVTASPLVYRGAAAPVEKPTRRSLYYSGDWPGNVEENSFRVFQAVSLVTDGTSADDADGDGREDATPDTTESKAMIGFAEDAISNSANRVISTQAWVDWSNGNGGDCKLYDRTDNLLVDNTNIDVGRINQTSVAARLSGSVNTPMGGKKAKGGIDWDLTVTIDTDGFWTVMGAHDGFPAYEISIDGTPVYVSIPADGPYTSKQISKLLDGSMDVTVNAGDKLP